MPRPPAEANRNKDFKGLVTNVAPHDRPLGAAVQQVNLIQIRRGQMRTRGGLRNIRWEN